MLDAQTKSRIDSARDILVGKVPDPKSQVEQITIALIYKFMDDMDRQAEELGGKATFFTGEFKKYRWAQLLDKRYGGHERLLLYAEGIEKMNENKNIPQLFRDIFKGVFLPYRDPETLNLFLKEINGFSYDHSERLGDAFEYLLSVLGTQGDAGQFRTPRHIIDFIVSVVDPKKDETILDPACGTAGFLVSAYKHILKENCGSGENCGLQIEDSGTIVDCELLIADLKEGDADNQKSRIINQTFPFNQQSKIKNPLSPDERARLMTNFRGYDIAPDMVRLARANMYLHGFPNPTIHEYDALTSEERWDERCDVILANPPFMTPKGGVRPHNRFSIKAKRSEVLFVDYIAEHLNPGGRAGVIVPEGIIFQGGNAYKQLRRMLVENYLWAVVSLPAGVFNPYSGVKTSILFLDKTLARRSNEVLFVKIENDGFDLGAQRRAIEKNDLPGVLRALKNYLNMDAQDGQDKNTESCISCPSMLNIPRSRILESPDVNLSGDRYRVATARHTGKWPMVKLGDLASVSAGNGAPQGSEHFVGGTIPFFRTSDVGKVHITADLRVSRDKLTEKVVNDRKLTVWPESTILFPKSGASTFLNHRVMLGCPGVVSSHLATVVAHPDKIRSHFLFHLLCRIDARSLTEDQSYPSLRLGDLQRIEIPLPPLDEQERIVAELEGYRKIIEGARQILAAYKPTIRIDPSWPVKPLGEFANMQYGLSASLNTKGRGYRTFRMNELIDGVAVDAGQMKCAPLTEKEFAKYRLGKGDILFNRTNSFEHVGRTGIFDLQGDYAFASYLIRVKVDREQADPMFVNRWMNTFEFQSAAKAFASRAIGQANINAKNLAMCIIPLPPLTIQRQIVAELESERKLIESNRELITRMEAKIKAKLAEVWGEPLETEGLPG